MHVKIYHLMALVSYMWVEEGVKEGNRQRETEEDRQVGDKRMREGEEEKEVDREGGRYTDVRQENEGERRSLSDEEREGERGRGGDR